MHTKKISKDKNSSLTTDSKFFFSNRKWEQWKTKKNVFMKYHSEEESYLSMAGTQSWILKTS